MTAAGAIRFYFDFISPYAWLGWRGLRPIADAFQRPIEPVPVLFAALLDAHGQLGPAEIPAKRRYVFGDAWRKARRMGLDLRLPPAHPFNPLTALRAVGQLDGDDQRRAIDACFEAVWGGGPGVHAPDVVARVLDEAGLDGAGLVAASRTPAVKDRLKRDTAEAIAAGVFGVPSMRVDGVLFWGSDSLIDLREHLEGRPSLPPEVGDGWTTLPAAAIRPGSRRGDST